jgi:glyoxylase-like metal-dependent hydrolase (beta-lactamase superfamily II)
MGGTAYLLLESTGNILIDCPFWDEDNQNFIRQMGTVTWLFITHRGGIGKVKKIQDALGCNVLIQEQEAYLLPNLKVTTFQQDFRLSNHSRIIWTPGHSPGSSCFYSDRHGGILFSGRHLLPDRNGNPMPLRVSKTFHWHRQLRSVQRVLSEFDSTTLHLIFPGANTGFLRGRRVIDRAYERLSMLDLDQLRHMQPGL